MNKFFTDLESVGGKIEAEMIKLVGEADADAIRATAQGLGPLCDRGVELGQCVLLRRVRSCADALVGSIHVRANPPRGRGQV